MASTAYGVAQSKWTHLPVPAEDGPQLVAVSLATKIYGEPMKNSKHIGYLRGDSLNKLVHSHECNRFAHEYATRLLEKRGRLRGRPNMGT